MGSEGVLKVTASFGVAATAEGDKNSLIAAADGALYTAKRRARTERCAPDAGTAELLSDRVPVTEPDA